MIGLEERWIVVERSARYYIGGTPGSEIEHVWMLCHGYGQLARDFLTQCGRLARENVLLVAPEGLSRFYHRSGRGSIGASWMTSEDRLAEIGNYIDYLNAVWDEICRECGKTPNASVLGFSQGGATAARWGILGSADVENIVLWGAAIPGHEIEQHAEQLRRSRLIMIEGEEDRIIRRAEHEESFETLRRLAIPFDLLTHSGGHELNERIMGQIAEIR